MSGVDPQGTHFMNRRALLKSAAGAGALAAASGLATPAVSQRAAARVLRLVPHADVANFDPIWSSAYIARNAGLLVWDTLYGVDAKLEVQRQMVEAEEVSADGLVWTFRMREALKFHDGEPVRAKDAVASINRWSARDPMGQMIKAIENELTAVDDRTFRWSLKKPYPKMLLALGKIVTPCCFVMPARIAATDPFKQINEYVGSGPMRFIKNEWTPGAKAVFEKFDDYVPRPEPASWLAGGKEIIADRIEWTTIADPATAAAALQNGEVDWLEQPLPDLVPALRKNRNVAVDIQDPLGAEPGGLHARLCRRRQHVEAAARLLHAGHAALQRGRRRNPQRPARSRCRQALVDAKRLCGGADRLDGRAGSCPPQGLGRYHRRSAAAPRRQR